MHWLAVWSRIGIVVPQVTAAIIAALFLQLVVLDDAAAQGSVRPPDTAVGVEPVEPVEGRVPGNALGNTSDAEIWRAIRQGISGTVSIPDEKAATLVRSTGESWRLLRNDELLYMSGLAILGTIFLLALFFAIRGRVRIRAGRSGLVIKRFGFLERAVHWMTATAFIILALTGLNITFGRDLIMPLIGKEAFGPISYYLKISHNFIAFVFMAGLVIEFIQWIKHNIPNRYDAIWIAKGGGIIGHAHAPAKKFNAGQKIIFWLTMLGGLSLSISGWALLYPFQTHFFSETFLFLQGIGIDVPSWFGLPAPPYDATTEQIFNNVWHAIMGMFMICLIIAHIYIGTIGMEGAFDAMADGDVDLNWAREHHDLWVARLERDGKLHPRREDPAVPGGTVQPAE